MTNNSKEEEERTVQNVPIENHDNSRNTEAMEGKLEQSQSILGEQREGDKPTAIMKKQQQMRPWRHLFHLPSRITPKGGSKYGLIIMLEPPHLINSLLYVFRPDIGGITPGLFVC